MEGIAFIFLIFFLFVAGFVLTTTIQALDTSSWSFAGSEMAESFIVYLPHIFLLIGAAAIVIWVLEKRK